MGSEMCIRDRVSMGEALLHCGDILVSVTYYKPPLETNFQEHQRIVDYCKLKHQKLLLLTLIGYNDVVIVRVNSYIKFALC